MKKKSFWEYFVKDKHEQDDESDSGTSSGGAGRIKPKEGEGFTSYLVEESEFMAYERRGLEQLVERQLASVEERKKPQRDNGNTPGGMEQKLKQHPLLDSQKFDGIDPGLNPAPFGNEEATIAFENEKREQDKEKQLRLGNMPQMGRNYLPELKM